MNTIMKNSGYRVLIVWERQWKENSQEILSKIKEAVNVL
jgi:G:T-mismatch repair DNA endonuclease (very short patch repair protein)